MPHLQVGENDTKGTSHLQAVCKDKSWLEQLWAGLREGESNPMNGLMMAGTYRPPAQKHKTR